MGGSSIAAAECREQLHYDMTDAESIADVRRCELCGKPKDRDDAEIVVDARDFATWMAALWWKDPKLAALVFARLMLPLAPLSELACLVGCSKATTTRLWQRLNQVAPMLAVWLRGAERRGGDRRKGAAR